MKEKIRSMRKNFIIYVVMFIILLGLCLFAKLSINSSFGADNLDLETKVNLEKYINYKISDEDKGTLVQYDIKTAMKYQGEDEEYNPIKQSQVKLELNKIDEKYPYDVKVITKSTEMTNGNKQIVNKNYQYNSETGTLIIGASNKNDNNELINSEKIKDNANDEYVVIAYYDTYVEEPEERKLSIKIGAIVVLNEEDRIVNHEEKFKGKVTNNIGELTSVSYTTDEIYNGYIKSNIINGTDYSTLYNEKQSIVISKKEAQETLELLEDNTFIKTENDKENDLGNNGKLVYKSTKIKKQDIINLLGNNGKLEILDRQGNILFTVDENTEYNEDGTILINYENDIESIVVKTSNIQNVGILELQNIKEIKSSMTNAVDTKIKTTAHIAGVNTEIINDKQTRKATFINKFENLIEIKDAKSSVNFEINNQKWTNKEQNEITFDVYINSNTIKDNMLKNPTVRIKLPEAVEKVILHNSSVVYANGLELQEPYLENDEEGKFVIVANLLGNQTQYDENELGLITDLRIAATVILKKDIENTEEKINLIYTNDYTLDESIEEINKDYSIEVLSYNSQETILQEQVRKTNNELQVSGQTAEIEGLELEVTPVKGDTVLKDGDIVYEGEFIKYNIKVTNITNRQIDNIKVIGTIPEGTIYGELKSNYNNSISNGNRFYSYHEFDQNTEQKEITIDSIRANETLNYYYEVKINELNNDEEEKQISSNIKMYVEDNEIKNYEITNIIKQAEYEVYLSSASQNRDINLYNYEIDVKGTGTVELKMKFPKCVNPIYYWEKDSGIKSTKITDQYQNNTLTLNVEAGIWVVQVSVDETKIEKNSNLLEWNLNTTAVINNTYRSNENVIPIELRKLNIKMISDNEGEEVKYGEEINYEINISIDGEKTYENKFFNNVSLYLTDYLPDNVRPISVTYPKNTINTETQELIKGDEVTEKIYYQDNNEGIRKPNVELNLIISPDEPIVVKVKTTAGYVYEKTKITNNAEVSVDLEKLDSNDESFVAKTDLVSQVSNTVTHTILPYSSNHEEPENPDTPEVPDEPSDPDSPELPDNTSDEEKPKDSVDRYSIWGIAWIDENEDGKRQQDEELLNDITVMLVDMNDTDKIKAKTTTDSRGKYIFSELDKGNYLVVFKYDMSKYRLTEYKESGVDDNYNSDAIDNIITLNGERLTVGITDIITLNENITNIDLGLIKNKPCDLRLDKYINEVTIETKNAIQTRSYNNASLVKSEIRAKEIEGAKVTVKYKIVITNEGEATTKVGKVIDYIPDDFVFLENSNVNWAIEDQGQIVNTSMENDNIKPGESVELNLVLTKTMTENSTGTYINKAEIGSISGTDIDSTPNNQKESEDDYSTASIIISIGTGAVIYISIALIIALILTLIVLNIKFNIFKKLKIKKLSLCLLIFTLIIIKSINVVNAESFDWISPGYHSNDSGSICFSGEGYYDAVHCQNDGVTPYSGDYGEPDSVTGGTWSEWSYNKGRVSIDIDGNTNDAIGFKLSGSNYLIGPLSITNNTDSEGYEISVYDSSSNKVSGWETCDESETTITVEGTKTFYIKIAQSKLTNGISKIEAKAVRSVTGTRTRNKKGSGYWSMTNYQDVATWDYYPTVTQTESYTSYASDIVTWTTINGILDIEKEDSNDENIKLSGVTINVKCNEVGYDRSFTTNSEGKIHIDNLKIGTYTLTETSNTNYGYIATGTWTTTISGGKSTKREIGNQKQTGNLFINKKDADTDKALEDIEFTIKATNKSYINTNYSGKTDEGDISDYGKYVKIKTATEGNNKKSYKGTIHITNMEFTSDESEATKFVTDNNGRIKIYNILKGYYDVEEVSVGSNNWQYDIDDNYISWNFHTYHHIDYYTISDDQREILNKFEFKGYYDADEKTKLTRTTAEGKNLNDYKEDNIGVSGDGKVAHIRVTGRASVNTPTSGTAQYESDRTYEELIFKNRRKYVKISGYAFEDKNDGKSSIRNNLYDKDGNDKLLKNIKVRLYIDGEIIEKTTDENGKYLFEKDGENNKIEIDKLGNAYIEFEYNGMSYQTTDIIKQDGKILYNSGNVVENKREANKTREQFNNEYAIIENNKALDSSGNYSHKLSYEGPKNHESKLRYGTDKNIRYGYDGQMYPVSGVYEQYVMTANTHDADDKKILGQDNTENDIRTNGIDELENINLGLYQREMPDLAIMKKLYNIKMTINGKEYLYDQECRKREVVENQQEYVNTYYNDKYTGRQRYKMDIDEDGVVTYTEDNNGEYIKENEEYVNIGIFNAGVRNETKYGSMSYARGIYKEDYEYVNSTNNSNELTVYVTYKIAMKNKSTNLKAEINNIVDYYDNRYDSKSISIGRELDENNLIKREISYSVDETFESEKYNKININTQTNLEPQKEENIYIQFILHRKDVEDILSNTNENEKTINNIVEINSYSVFDENGYVYAGIDKNSNPGNVEPGNNRTYEDDTDEAEGVKFSIKSSRDLSGKVFLDSTSNELMTGQTRQGSGKYEYGEQGISGVEVSLIEVTNINGKIEQKQDGKVYKTKTINLGNSKYGFYKDEKDDGIYYNYEIYDDNKKNEYEYISDELENGEFLISKFIPGDYVMTYTWGNETYIVNSDGTTEKLTVQEYKGTIWTKENKKEKEDNKDNWYNINADTRYSDARDIYSIRKSIDSETINTDNTVYTTNTMISETNKMDIGVDVNLITTTLSTDGLGDINNDGKIDQKDIELIQKSLVNEETLTSEQLDRADINRDGKVGIIDVTYIERYISGITSNDTDFDIDTDGTIIMRPRYKITNVDFGIVKRPIQALNLNKKVKNIKIATAKGQIIVDFNINEDGTYEDVKGVTYMAPSVNNSPQNGLIRLELDSELLQSAKMNVTYAISVKNDSEIDYDSQYYYWYGELAKDENADDKIVKLKPEKIYDYIDQGFEFNKNDNLDAENNPIWELKETKEYNDEEVKYTFIEEAYSEYREDTVDDEGNMIEKEGYEYYRGGYKEIFESWKQETLEKRKYKEKAREYKLDSRNILELKIDIDNLTPGQEVKIQELKVKKDLSNSNEIDLSNDSEITQISRNTHTGSKITPSKSVIYTRGEDVRITPPTGKKDHNIEIIIITISSLIIIATGIIFIKRKILN